MENFVKGCGKILLVDNEDFVVDILLRILKHLGYEVCVAKSGQEAINIFQKNEEEIGLVILDMVMPEMSGLETLVQLRKINPKIKIILSSGYEIDEDIQSVIDEGFSDFIQKPFGVNQVSSKIEEILKK
jgi:CheY-like chemotaxis protein